MVTPDYTVHLDAFEGPLDLLLFLIRRAEVEITDIPISKITEQYLRYLDQFSGTGRNGGGRIDIERAGEFLVMAATLMEIKSRMLAPQPRGDGDAADDAPGGSGRFQEVDPRAELVRQLLEYKRYRDATDRLETYRREWDDRFPAAGFSRSAIRAILRPSDPLEGEEAEENAAPVELEDVSVVDLVEAFARIVESVDFNRVGEHHVLMDDTPVELHAEDIVDRLRRAAGERAANAEASELEFTSLFTGKTRAEAIGMFLAILELVKQQRVSVRQDDAARIVLSLREEQGSPPAPSAASAERGL